MSSKKESKTFFWSTILFLSMVFAVSILLLCILLFDMKEIAKWLQNYGGLIGSIFAVIIASYTIKNQSDNTLKQIEAEKVKAKFERKMDDLSNAKFLAQTIRHRAVRMSTASNRDVDFTENYEDYRFNNYLDCEQLSSISLKYGVLEKEVLEHNNITIHLYLLRSLVAYPDNREHYLMQVDDMIKIFEFKSMSTKFLLLCRKRVFDGEDVVNVYRSAKDYFIRINTNLLRELKAIEAIENDMY